MNTLTRRALARVALTKEAVERLYGLPAHPAAATHAAVRELCESHERLRAEVEGCEAMLEKAGAAIKLALALTDTGSPEFRAAFPADSAAAGICPREHVPGWRVVAQIREALLRS